MLASLATDPTRGQNRITVTPPYKALTSHFPSQQGVELSFQSILRDVLWHMSHAVLRPPWFLFRDIGEPKTQSVRGRASFRCRRQPAS
jgi:hypothetical protein